MKISAGIIFLAFAAIASIAVVESCDDDFCACAVEVTTGADGTTTTTCPDLSAYDAVETYDCYPDEDGGGTGYIICAGYQSDYFTAGSPTITKGCTISNGEGMYSWIISDGAYNVGPTISNYNSFSSPAPSCAEAMAPAEDKVIATVERSAGTSTKLNDNGFVWIMTMTTILPLMTPLLRF